MKRLQECFIQEISYKYVSETEKEMHKNHMISKGFRVVHNSPILDNPLNVTYQHRQIIDGIERL